MIHRFKKKTQYFHYDGKGLKKIMEFSTGGGESAPDFPLRKKYGLILFSPIFGWGDPSQLGSWSEGYVKPLKLCGEAI